MSGLWCRRQSQESFMLQEDVETAEGGVGGGSEGEGEVEWQRWGNAWIPSHVFAHTHSFVRRQWCSATVGKPATHRRYGSIVSRLVCVYWPSGGWSLWRAFVTRLRENFYRHMHAQLLIGCRVSRTYASRGLVRKFDVLCDRCNRKWGSLIRFCLFVFNESSKETTPWKLFLCYIKYLLFGVLRMKWDCRIYIEARWNFCIAHLYTMVCNFKSPV